MIKSSAVIMPVKTSAKVLKAGFNVKELDYWQSTDIGKFGITVVPAKHQGICAGFIIEGSKTIYKMYKIKISVKVLNTGECLEVV